MLVLGIETSCDETGLALVEDGRRVLGSQLASSLKQHQRYGGVIPEIASRAHVELLTRELEALMESCGVSGEQVDRIAVTSGPGLSGALLVGVAAAKALALAWAKRSPESTTCMPICTLPSLAPSIGRWTLRWWVW